MEKEIYSCVLKDLIQPSEKEDQKKKKKSTQSKEEMHICSVDSHI